MPETAAVPGPRGHRFVEHRSDCVIEAWGPDASSCILEALNGLIESFAEVGDTPVTSVRPLVTDCRGVEDALVALLEEVIFHLEVSGEVPVRFHLETTDIGGFAGDMEVVPVSDVELIGPVPKGVSYHGLEMAHREGAWRCQVLIDQ